MNFNQRFHKKYNNVEVKSFYRKEKLFWVKQILEYLFQNKKVIISNT
ncbi:hypothetical protein LEP1GSC132_2045 [Leptospira kirschneri str. 200803703]|uniref:Uncharacterized protein n=2 Tax=Leptospira kirschneri TaxID=29507 RepID=A0A828Y5J1_9LEPT|nr:hypothetical protein LEP1GSC044_3552 [Leptospira kirschneri serovar Grippotyphosa str. RM52]EKO52227.1 hypothetical protein LEP1GSC131_3620 [Leptospira kirschneri str. 200802841]EKQ85259.1 hypothetical protein LEP1GSC064_1601 [Leptospira kirschneri serovar Grippotyphosa str. Moskva]EKR06781.1 hypothetical protein LEP1GSC122_0979 [Leptospira kirschneri serovar Valbuzzi str. 200702274]EMJ87371.1 hypothetical protein LEP1GSC198_3765 [Leptospira kirschneri str. JB]EMK02394.1 hypothetical protei